MMTMVLKATTARMRGVRMVLMNFMIVNVSDLKIVCLIRAFCVREGVSWR